jgi:hypothetical protein
MMRHGEVWLLDLKVHYIFSVHNPGFFGLNGKIAAVFVVHEFLPLFTKIPTWILQAFSFSLSHGAVSK